MVTTSTGSTRTVLGNPYSADCPTRHILDRIGDRWTVLVVSVLGGGETRFSQLRRQVEGVSQKMLTQTLRNLERDGLVERIVYPEVSVRVQYSLTDTGRSLLGPLRALQEWSVDHLADVSSAQRAFDRADSVRSDPQRPTRITPLDRS